jgi:hypothetical protein
MNLQDNTGSFNVLDGLSPDRGVKLRFYENESPEKRVEGVQGENKDSH